MKNKLVVLLVGVFITVWAGVTMAQQAESQLRLVEEVHVYPFAVAEFEEASKARTARMAKGNVTFAFQAAVNERGVYRFTTLLENGYASLDKRREQLDARPPADPVNQARASEAIDHIDRSITRSRPELSYIPANPRLEPSEIGLLREYRIHLKRGAGREGAELIQKISELYKTRNLRDYRLVNSQVIGPEGQVFFIVFPSRDAADYYTQRARNAESIERAGLGEEFQALLSQLNGLTRRIEPVNYTTRRDLAYRPSN